MQACNCNIYLKRRKLGDYTFDKSGTAYSQFRPSRPADAMKKLAYSNDRDKKTLILAWFDKAGKIKLLPFPFD